MQRPAPVVRRGLCVRLPACGEGAIAKAPAASGHEAVIANRYAYGFVQAGIGFLAGGGPKAFCRHAAFPRVAAPLAA
jgi:hypothetical protein